MSSEGLKLTNNSGELEPSEHNNSPGLAQSLPEEGRTSGAIEKARDHVTFIRRSKGLDRLEGQDSTANIEDLEKALDVLSDQLYSQPTHFLLEFIQNADDNSYADVMPTISFTSVCGHLRIDCNEIGFSPANVESICRINNSTKKDRSKGFIGEKGIGFKSVFKIADVVWISSRAYHFKFDRSARLGMIAPIWEDWKDFPGEQYPGHAESDSTQFYLQLSKEKDSHAEKDLLKQLRFFDSTLLLFLRKLKKIEILVNDDDWKKRFTNHITRSETHAYGGELITIKKKWAKTKKADETLRYFVVRHNTSDMPMEPKRKGMEASEVVLAFPFIENKPAFHMQKAYAFLPIRDSGFRVSLVSCPVPAHELTISSSFFCMQTSSSLPTERISTNQVSGMIVCSQGWRSVSSKQSLASTRPKLYSSGIHGQGFFKIFPSQVRATFRPWPIRSLIA
jgi:hypothetical protein